MPDLGPAETKQDRLELVSLRVFREICCELFVGVRLRNYTHNCQFKSAPATRKPKGFRHAPQKPVLHFDADYACTMPVF
jgi:hypothetical protein